MSPPQGRPAQVVYADWEEVTQALSAGIKANQDNLPDPLVSLASSHDDRPSRPSNGSRDAFYIILPMLIVLSTFLFLLLLFLVCVILLRRRLGIMLRDTDGPGVGRSVAIGDSGGGWTWIASSAPETEEREPVRA